MISLVHLMLLLPKILILIFSEDFMEPEAELTSAAPSKCKLVHKTSSAILPVSIDDITIPKIPTRSLVLEDFVMPESQSDPVDSNHIEKLVGQESAPAVIECSDKDISPDKHSDDVILPLPVQDEVTPADVSPTTTDSAESMITHADNIPVTTQDKVEEPEVFNTNTDMETMDCTVNEIGEPPSVPIQEGNSEQCDSGVDLVEDPPVMTCVPFENQVVEVIKPSAFIEDKFVAVDRKPVSLLDSRIRIVQCTANDKPIHFSSATPAYKCILNGSGAPKLAYSIIGNRMVDVTPNKVQKETVVVDSTTIAAPRTPPKNRTVSQSVSQLLSPNFKLTMTNCIPNEPKQNRSSSLVIGNIGSTTIKVPAAAIPTHNMPMKPQRNLGVKQAPAISQVLRQPTKKMTMRYPNVSMKAVPKDHPLLDHDYCYHSYLDLVQAAKKLVNRVPLMKSQSLDGTKQPATKSGYQPKSITVVMEDGTIRRKYRTKRIIAAELEETRRNELRRKAEAGDTQAQQELDDIKAKEDEEVKKENVKQEKKLRRNNKRRDSANSTGTAPSVRQSIDSEEEVNIA